jgi:translation initiation factor 3 subunit L
MYSSLDASKLAGFLDADEEEIVQQMMVMKGASRSVSRAAVVGEGGGLLDGVVISTSDLDFVIDEVRFIYLSLSRRFCLVMNLTEPTRIEHGSNRGEHDRAALRRVVYP